MNTQTLPRLDAVVQQVDRRLLILEILHQAHDNRMNEIILKMILHDAFIDVGQADLRTDLFWLQTNGLVLITVVHDLYIAELTSFGRQAIECQQPSRPHVHHDCEEKNGSIQEKVDHKISEVEA